METKIKIYSILIGVIYFLIVCSSIYHSRADFRKGYEEGRKDSQETAITLTGESNKNANSESFYLNLRPINDRYTFSQTVTNVLTGKSVDIEIKSCIINAEKYSTNISSGAKIFFIIRIITFVFVFLIILYIPILFLLIVKSIWQNNLMNQKLVKRIKRMGWILLSLYLYMFIFFDFGEYYLALQCISLENYKIILDYGNCELIVLGLLTLMLGEILSHTLKMKEEQDLTI